MNKPCLNCGKPMANKRGDAKFCSVQCRNAHSNQLRPSRSLKGKLSGLPLKPTVQAVKKPLHVSRPLGSIEKSIPGIEKPTTAIPDAPAPENTLPVPKPAPLVFSNVIYSDTGLPVHEKPKPEVPVVLPPALLTTTQINPNPVYTSLQTQIVAVNEQGRAMNQTLLAIEAKIKEVKSKDGSEHVAYGLSSGAILGYQLGKPQTSSLPLKIGKTGKTRLKAPEDNRTLYAVLCGLAGAIVGNLAKVMTEKSREAEKAQQLKDLYAQHHQAVQKVKQLQAQRDSLGRQIFGIPQTITKQVQVTNPAYAPALKKQQEQKERIAKAAQALLLGNAYPAGGDPHETGRILSAANMSQIRTTLLDFKDPWLKLLGQPQTNFKMLVTGESGGGKSHFAIGLAKYLAGFGRVLYVSGEEGFAATFQDKIKVFGANQHPNFYTGDFRTGTELLDEAPDLYHFIVIDSINDMGISYEQFCEIIEKFSQSGIISVFQSTKAGKIRGSNEFIHKSDIAVQVTNGIAKTIKNRYKATGETFDIMGIYKGGGD